MRVMIGCRRGRYGAGSTDWPLVAFRAAKAWPLRNTRGGTFRGAYAVIRGQLLNLNTFYSESLP